MTETPIERAKRIANAIRSQMPEKAAEIDRLVDDIRAGAKPMEAALRIKASISYRLEKFDGDYQPGKQPVEVIEGTDNL